MLIDWFTVSAQVLNFLILVWLMKRYLYRPILNAIDEREQKFADELMIVDKKKADAQRESDEFQRKNDEFEEQRTALLTKATAEAKATSQRLLEEEKKTAADLNLKRQEALKKQEQDLQQTIAIRIQQEVFSMTRKALKDLANSDLEERMMDVFMKRLNELTAENKKQLLPTDSKLDDPMVIRTNSKLSPEQRNAIQTAIQKSLGTPAQIQFENSSDFTGIELTANGQKLGWNTAEYLGALESSVAAHGA
jgi:F-type H+-transporting ATPase subunit b